MKSDLDELIEILEAELNTLGNYIKIYVEESEYLMAHHHSQALFKIQNQLYKLHKLKDPFYDEKRRLEQMINIFEKRGDMRKTAGISAYYENRVGEYKEQLRKLNEQKSKPAYDEQNLDDAIFKIIDGIHNGFIFYLNVQDNLSFTFEKSGATVEISISIKSILKIDYFVIDEEEDSWPFNKFKALGFNLAPAGNMFIYRFDTNHLKDVLSIKTLLSRVIYDLFNYDELDNPASLAFF